MAEEQGKPPRRRRSPSGGQHGEHPEEAVGAHAAFVAAHFGGGAAATPELLDRAIEVWQQLPGAVVRGAPLIRPNRPDRSATDPGDEPR